MSFVALNPKQVDLWILSIESHAWNYTAPRTPGPTEQSYNGWVLTDLVSAAMHGCSSAAKGQVAAEFMRKHSPMAGISGRPSTGPLPSLGMPLHQHAGVAGGTIIPNTGRVNNYSPLEMLAMRMRWDYCPGGFAYIAVHKGKEKAFVFIVTYNEASVVLEDELGLYPSDALISKLRLLEEPK